MRHPADFCAILDRSSTRAERRGARPSAAMVVEMSARREGGGGWRIVLAMFLVTAIIYGVAIYGFIILSQPLGVERGFSRAQAGNLVSAMWLAAPLALFCAPIIARVGAWRLLVAGLLIEAAAFAAITGVEQFWQVYALRMAMGMGKIFAIVSMPVIVSQWFSKRFGTAIAFAWCGGSFGGLVIAPLAEVMGREFGWRPAILMLSALTVVTTSLIACLGYSAGHPIRGERQRERDRSAAPRAGEGASTASVGWREIRSINWLTAALMAFAVAISGIAAIAFTIEAPSLMEAIGYSPANAATILGLTAAGAILGQLGAGWMLDRFSVRVVALETGAAVLTGLIAFHLLKQNPAMWAAVLAALIFGAGMGACEVLWITLTKRQFGTGLFAVSYGAWSFSYQFGYAAGGWIGGRVYEAATPAMFLTFIGLLYLPAVALSMWRPAARNEP